MKKEHTTCPYCKEEIKSEATKCKHCNSEVIPKRLAHNGTCPYCKESVHKEAIKCKHCKSSIELSKGDCGCGCQGETQAVPMMLRRPAGFADQFGQGCYYDCIDHHRDHGDDMSDPRIKRHCERKCQISMPAFSFPQMMARYYY